MCLTIRSKTKPRAKVAKKNITAYKLIIGINSNGEGRTSYKYAEIKLGNEYESNIAKPEKTIWSSQWIVEEGLHSLLDKREAISLAVYHNESLVKIIIPKGSKYYIGEFAGRKSIVSNKIRYTNKIIYDPDV